MTTKEYGGGSLPCNFDNMLYSEKYDDLRGVSKKSTSPIMHIDNILDHKSCDSSKPEVSAVCFYSMFFNLKTNIFAGIRSKFELLSQPNHNKK